MATLNKTLKKFRYEKRRQIIDVIAEKKGVSTTFLREKKKVYVGVSI